MTDNNMILDEIEARFLRLSFSDDFMFCKVLTDNPELCKELIELILGRKIKKISEPVDQKTIKQTKDGKGVRLDVYFEDEENVIYDIEMQTSSRDLPRRSRYYQGMIDQGHLKVGAEYSKLKNSYIIFICTFDEFGKGRHFYSFKKRCNEDFDLYLDDGSNVVFLCADGDLNDVSDEMQGFLDYVSGASARNEFTKRIDEAVQTIRNNPERRLEYMTSLLHDADVREEGRAEGRAEMLYMLVLDGELSAEKAAERKGVDIDEFTEGMMKYKNTLKNGGE